MPQSKTTESGNLVVTVRTAEGKTCEVVVSKDIQKERSGPVAPTLTFRFEEKYGPSHPGL